MPVAYQSWEVASASIVGFNMAIQGNLCTAAADIVVPEKPNYSSCTILSLESFMNAVRTGTDISLGLSFPSHKVLTAQETVIQGISSLSLHPRSPCEDSEISPSYESSQKALELDCSTPLASDGKKVHDYGSGFKGVEDVSCGDSALQLPSGSDLQGSVSPNTRNYLPHYDNHRNLEFYDFPKHTLDAVDEDKPIKVNFTLTGNDKFEHYALSASTRNSVSSIDSLVEASISLGGGRNGVDSEASLFKESSNFTGASSPPRKGLSRFYAGKSRSFSCLGDGMSLRDLAKPENPCARKRRCHVGGRSLNICHPRLPPLQKGAASISKKSLHNGKSTLAVAATMSTRDSDQTSPGVERCQQNSSLTSRSYSLSDLQKAAERGICLS